MTNLAVRMARWSAGHPWRGIAAWFLFVALCLGIGSAVGGHAATTEDFRIGEAGRAEALAAEGGLQQKPVEHVLITGRGAGADAAAKDAAARMKALPEVESVSAPVRSADGTAVRVDVTLKGPELEGKEHVDPLIAQTAAVRRAHPDVRVEETGGPSISKGVGELRSEDLARTEVIALPITLVTLLVVFGSFAVAVVPVVLALSSIAAAIGLSMLASHVFPDAGIGASIILLIGMAVGVDYTLFYLKREREERARSGGRLDARATVELAAATSGRSVVVSGLAVAVSSATLYLADDVIFSSIATAAIVVTLVAVVSSLTVLPAVLAKLGGRAERRAVRRGRTPKAPRTGTGRVTRAMLRPTGRHPAATLAVSALLMLALTAPLLNLNLTDMGRDSHPRAIPAMRVYDRLTAAFPELKAAHQIVVKAGAGDADEVRAALDGLARRAERDPLLAGTSDLRTSPDGRISVLELPVPHHASTREAKRSLERVRDEYVPETVGALDAETAVIVGSAPQGSVAPASIGRTLRRTLDRFAEDTGLTVSADLPDVDCDQTTRIALLRCTQESLANVRKHAAASTVGIVLERRPHGVELEITDDGRGFTAGESPGFGLDGMRRRLAELGGELTVTSSPGDGTRVFATIPLKA